jgi:putative MATE family efflux protein
MYSNAKRLGEENINKLLFSFSLPAIIGALVNSFYALIDRIFVGQFVGKEAFEGVGITFPIALVLMAFGMLIGIGTTARVSIKLGEQKKDEAEQILGNAFTLQLIFSFVLSSVCLFFLDDLLYFFGASAEILPYAKQFISIILLAAVFQFVGFGLNGILAAEGHPRLSMLTMILNAGINIVLLILFIRVLKWGVAGSALATLIAQAVAAAWVLGFLRSKKSMLKLRVKNMALKKEIILGIFSIGMSPFAMQIAAGLVMAVLNRRLTQYGGDAAIGAMNAMFGTTIFMVMPLIGISQGAQPIIGYNYGARLYKRVKKTLKAAIVVATIHAVTVFVLMQSIPHFFIQLFTNDPEIVTIGTHGIRIYTLLLPVIGFQIISANFFLSIGKAWVSLLMNMLRQVIILIPLLIILPPFFDLDGIWMSVPISDLSAAMLTAVFVIIEIRRLDEAHAIICAQQEIPDLYCAENLPEAEASEFVP